MKANYFSAKNDTIAVTSFISGAASLLLLLLLKMMIMIMTSSCALRDTLRAYEAEAARPIFTI